jgi:cell division protease FtsH
MISEFGMSQSLGLVSLGLQNQMYQGTPFIKNEYAPVSEKLSQAIDEESRKILEDEFKEACKILSENRLLVERMTKVLLEKETIEYDEMTAFFEDSNKSNEVALSLNP